MKLLFNTVRNLCLLSMLKLKVSHFSNLSNLKSTKKEAKKKEQSPLILNLKSNRDIPNNSYLTSSKSPIHKTLTLTL